MFYLPDFNEVQEILLANPNPLFYETINYIDGYEVRSYNYRFATYFHMKTPLIDKPYIDAFELRGLTFINNNGIWNRYVCMRKFFNIGQVPETHYDVVKSLKIKKIENKIDGSLISFIKLPSGKIMPKSKMGFDSDITSVVTEIVNNNPSLSKFISELLDKGLISLWEYRSYRNRIVINYIDEKLVLLKIRDMNTGEYLDLKNFDTSGIDVVEDETNLYSSIDELISFCENSKDENKEGFVVEFENDLFCKFKLETYRNRHKLLTENLNHENVIISMFLSETLDDIIGQLNPNDPRILWIKEITDKVTKYIHDTIEFLKPYDDEFKNLVETKTKELNLFMNNEEEIIIDAKKLATKDFALKYRKHEMFNFIISLTQNKDMVNVISSHILKSTSHLMEARNFLNSINL